MSKINFQFFPRSKGIKKSLVKVIGIFEKNSSKFTSENHTYTSNEVLEFVRKDLELADFKVEKGKKDKDKIKVPVLYGANNNIDKFFNADAVSNNGKIVIEVEAGRAVVNNQFLKDIFQASIMYKVEYLVIVARNNYRNNKDFEKIYTFLETMYVSNRIKLPLKGILLIGY